MPDLRYRMSFTLEIDDREFKLIGKGLSGKLNDRTEKLEAAILLSRLMSIRQRILQEQQEQTARIGLSAVDEISKLKMEIGTPDSDQRFNISSAASGSEASSDS